MRKLLLTSFSLGVLLIISCQNASTPENKIISPIDSNIKNSTSVKDTLAIQNQTPSVANTSREKGSLRDTSVVISKENAIIHHAPNESKIDSIKNAKLKGKK